MTNLDSVTGSVSRIEAYSLALDFHAFMRANAARDYQEAVVAGAILKRTQRKTGIELLSVGAIDEALATYARQCRPPA